jgi:hypothetical protein
LLLVCPHSRVVAFGYGFFFGSLFKFDHFHTS